MKYALETGSGIMKHTHIPTFIKFGLRHSEVNRRGYTNTAWRSHVYFNFFQNKECRLISVKAITESSANITVN
jgi:hypothetical protein